MIIAIVSQKGGAGKTTVATNLATVGVKNGLSVHLIDLDPQASATNWHLARDADDIELTVCHPPMLAKTVDKINIMTSKGSENLIIIDTPPHNSTAAANAVKVADMVLIPVRPSSFDLSAIQDTVDLIEQNKTPFAAIINAVPANSKVEEAAIEFLHEYGVEHVIGSLGQRMAFQHATADGKGVVEIENGKSAQEVNNLWRNLND